jgi:hypothetical protein
MPFKKGDENINRNGRPEGSKDKFTCLKDWILEVAKENNAKEKLTELINGSKHDKRWFFEQWIKLFPKNITFDDNESDFKLTIERKVVKGSEAKD